MKRVAAILLSGIFLVNCVMVPFCNFQDTSSAGILYSEFLQRDSDGDVLEFITHNMLNIGILLGDEEDDDADQLPSTPAAQHHPFQPLQITPGFLYCPQLVFSDNNNEPVTPRVFCSFVDNNYQQDFSSSIFHPPTTAC